MQHTWNTAIVIGIAGPSATEEDIHVFDEDDTAPTASKDEVFFQGERQIMRCLTAEILYLV